MSQPPYGTQPPYGGQPPFGGQPPTGGQPPYGGPPNPVGGSQPGWGQPTPSQPPPPPPTQPGYGPPPTASLPSYGPPTDQFGAPGAGGYGAPGGQPPYGGGPGQPYGPPQPDKKSPVPFIILGLVVLLVLGGVGLAFFLNKDDPTPVVAPTATSTSTQSTEDTGSPTEDTESSTEDTSSPGGDEPNFAESEDVAIAFMQLMVDGDYDTALTQLCEDGRDPSDGDGFAAGQNLADDFFLELGATTITGGETTAVAPSDIDRDIVTFDLDTDVGVVVLDVQVLEEEIGAPLTICGYDIP